MLRTTLYEVRLSPMLITKPNVFREWLNIAAIAGLKHAILGIYNALNRVLCISSISLFSQARTMPFVKLAV
jgi:hypothetical protein